jgi:hypothetical protein
MFYTAFTFIEPKAIQDTHVLQVAAGQPAFLPSKDIKKRLAGGNLLLY